jgi:hypothetical protein
MVGLVGSPVKLSRCRTTQKNEELTQRREGAKTEEIDEGG